MKATAQTDFVLECLRRGETRAEILSKFKARWNATSRTVDNRLRQAREALAKERAALDSTRREELQKAYSQSLRTSLEKQFHLQRLIDELDSRLMEAKTSQEVCSLTVAIARLYAELNKMQGDYGATPVKETPPHEPVAKKYFEQVDALLRAATPESSPVPEPTPNRCE